MKLSNCRGKKQDPKELIFSAFVTNFLSKYNVEVDPKFGQVVKSGVCS